MSNWLRAKISTEIKNPKRSLFEKALDNMGYKPDYSLKTVHGAYSYETAEKVDCVLRNKVTNEEQTIGFSFKHNKEGETVLSVSGDFFRCGFSGETFMKRLGLQYNYENTKAIMEERGFVIEETTQENNQIVMVGYRQVA